MTIQALEPEKEQLIQPNDNGSIALTNLNKRKIIIYSILTAIVLITLGIAFLLIHPDTKTNNDLLTTVTPQASITTTLTDNSENIAILNQQDFHYPTGFYKTSFSELSQPTASVDLSNQISSVSSTEPAYKWKNYILYSDLDLYVFDLKGNLKYMMEKGNKDCPALYRRAQAIIGDSLFVQCNNPVNIVMFDLNTGKIQKTWTPNELGDIDNLQMLPYKNKIMYATRKVLGVIDPTTGSVKKTSINACAGCMDNIYNLNGQIWLAYDGYNDNNYAIYDDKNWNFYTAPEVYEYIYPENGITKMLGTSGYIYTFDENSKKFNKTNQKVDSAIYKSTISDLLLKNVNIKIKKDKNEVYFINGSEEIKLNLFLNGIFAFNKTNIGSLVTTNKGIYKLSEKSFDYIPMRIFDKELFPDQDQEVGGTLGDDLSVGYYDYKNTTLYFIIRYPCFEECPQTLYLLKYNYTSQDYRLFNADTKTTKQIEGLTFTFNKTDYSYSVTFPDGRIENDL